MSLRAKAAVVGFAELPPNAPTPAGRPTPSWRRPAEWPSPMPG